LKKVKVDGKEVEQPESLEEYQTALTAIADIPGTLNDEQVAQYKTLEKDMVAFKESADVKSRNATWNKPRPNLLPVAPKGEDKEREYAFERYVRGDLGAAQDLIRDPGVSSNMARYDQTLTTTAGGYLIPTTTENRIIEVMKNFGGVATVAEELITAAGTPINYPSNDDTANTAEIDAVNVGMTSAGADLVFGQVTLGAFSYMAGGASNAALHVPFELAQDSQFPIVPFVERKLGTRLARKQSSDFAIGTGTTLPQGLFDRIPDINLLSGNFTQTAAVNYGQLVGALAVAGGGQGVVFTLDPDYLPNATWIMRYPTLGILASITDTTGRPIFEPFGGSSFQQADMTSGSTPGAPDAAGGYRPAGRLLGYPVIVDQAAPAVGNASIAKPGAANDAFISFGDHRQAYIIRRVQGTTILVDPFTAMSKRQIGYFCWARADAKIQASKAHVLLAGWNAA
jgi:HK97 family phage major capsid protein